MAKKTSPFNSPKGDLAEYPSICGTGEEYPSWDQALVMGLVMAGCSISEVADILKRSQKSILSDFESEIAFAEFHAGDKEFTKRMMSGHVVAAFFKACMGGNVAAQIFWLKSQLGWEDKQITEVDLRSENSIVELTYEQPESKD